jgi:signal transduction histidine kinase
LIYKDYLLGHKSIKHSTILGIVLVAFLTLFVLIFIIYSLNSEHQKEIETIEKKYIKTQKELIKKETLRALKYIAYKDQKDRGKKSISQIQSDIVDAIEHMRDTRDGTGYIFIYTFDGINIADPILKHNSGKNLLHVEDKNGKKVIQELIDISKKEDGGYVEYVWNKPISNILAPKISYAISYKPWKWMLGSGVYLDNVYSEIEKKKLAYKSRVSRYIIGILSLATLLFFIGTFTYKYFASTITNDINYIEHSLKEVSSLYKTIDIQHLQYKEFIKITNYINSMVVELKQKSLKLEDLNQNLEKKVEIKTKKLKSAKDFAESVVEAQDRFIKNAIHEINTPLSIMITNIDLYRISNPPNRYLTKIEAAAKIIHNIYNDLSYSAKKDYLTYDKTTINFSNFLNDRLEFFSEVAQGNHISISKHITADIKIEFNETQLQRICDNNISNAIKYSFQDSTIEIYLLKKDSNVIFQVVNSGKLIEFSNRVFERFYREDSSRGGFGIGLNIVKEICDNNNVAIELDSQNSSSSFKYTFKGIDENFAS